MSDQEYYRQMLDDLRRDGVSAIWTGSLRHCGNYPDLTSGMPGIYIHAPEDERLSMFYPDAWNHRYGVHANEDDIEPKTFSVSQDFLERCAGQNSCSTLNMHEPAKSTGKVISWNRRTWICFGSVSRGHKTLEAMLCEVVPEEVYKGPPNNPKSGHFFYTGGRFRARGRVWVMTDKEITLVPSDETEIRQLKLFEHKERD